MWNRSPVWPPRDPFDAPIGGPPTDPATNMLVDRGVTDPGYNDPYQDGQWAPVLAPVETRPENDQIRSESYVPPYHGPGDLDDYGRETDEMRRAYDDLHRKEPTVRAAIDGKAGAVACLDLSVLPRNKDKPNDVLAAKWVKECIDDAPHGADGLVSNMVRAALVRGFSAGEKVLEGKSTEFGPRWGLKHVKSKDTNNLRLRLDAYRNVIGVVNTVRGYRTHDPGKVILFTHADMYDNPFGQSDLRAAYRNANLINDAYKLWHIGLQLWGQPFLKGKVKDGARLKMLEAALKAARGAGYIALLSDDDVELLNFASATSFDAFEKKVQKCREEIFLAVRGAYLPFLEGSGGADNHGNTDISKKVGSDPVEYLLAKAVGRCLTHQLVPDLVIPNFPAGTGLPIIVLGGVGWDETLKQLEVAEKLQTAFGLKTSSKHLYEVSQMPPGSEGDSPPGPAQPGMPGAGQPGQPATMSATPAIDADELKAWATEYLESKVAA